MSFKFKIVSAFCLVAVVFNSCKNELNILAPYKESVSVYAVLNPQDVRNYVRINRIFLGEGNSFQMAQVNDSINYKKGELTVTLERYDNGVLALTTVGNPTKKLITLNDTVIQTQSGVFNSNQRLFYTDDKLYTWGDYKLTITNNKTGNVFTSKGAIIDSVKPFPFPPIAPPYYPVAYNPSNPSSYYIDFSLPTVNRVIRFNSVPGARDYDLVMRFHYADSLNTGALVPKFVDFNFPTVSTADLSGGEQLALTFTSGEFYSVLVSKLNADEPSNLLFRKILKVDFIVYAGAQDFVDFLKISAPSTSVAQDKPVYSNIEGGFGIFSSRSRLHVSKQISVSWIDYMATTKPTCNLRFLKSDGNVSAICN